MILESFNGKIIKSVEVIDERVIVSFTDDSAPMNIASSEWISVVCNEYYDIQNKVIEENKQQEFLRQEARDAEMRKRYPGFV